MTRLERLEQENTRLWVKISQKTACIERLTIRALEAERREALRMKDYK